MTTDTTAEDKARNADFSLNIIAREVTGTTHARNFRKKGLVPAIAYELGKDSISFLLEEREFKRVAVKALSSQIFTLGDGVKEIAGRKALVKEIQRDGLRGDVLHVDFLLLQEKRPSLVTVPVVVTGEAPGVKIDGGVLTVQCREVTLLSPPESIPSELDISVTSLRLGQRIRTGDIELPAGVVLKSSPDETVVNVLASRATKLDGEEGAESAAEGETEGEAAAS